MRFLQDIFNQYPVTIYSCVNKDATSCTLIAIAAAVLFGASAPLSKVLLSQIDPIAMAGLLYLGSGTGLLLFRVIMKFFKFDTMSVKLGMPDLPWLMVAVFAGGVVAPIMLMYGLSDTPAATASLLLNFECVSTTLIAVMIFKDVMDRRIWAAILLVTAASFVLSYDPGSQWGVSIGALGVIGACVFWGIDNNFTRNICGKDPVSIGMVKGLVAGSFSLLLALALGQAMPDAVLILYALALGSVSYGLSIVLFIFSMRGLGAARSSAWLSTAPFTGAIIAFIVLREEVYSGFLLALPIMLAGAALLFFEEHKHVHVHAGMEHDHCHSPGDLYHEHEHTDD